MGWLPAEDTLGRLEKWTTRIQIRLFARFTIMLCRDSERVIVALVSSISSPHHSDARILSVPPEPMPFLAAARDGGEDGRTGNFRVHHTHSGSAMEEANKCSPLL